MSAAAEAGTTGPSESRCAAGGHRDRVSAARCAPHAHADLHPRRLRLRAAARADRPAPGGRAQRLAPARRPRPLPVDRVFRDLPALLRAGDLLVFNDTRVIKARLLGDKPSGGAVRRWSSACCPATRCWRTCAPASRRAPGSARALCRRLRCRGAGPRRARRRAVPPALPGRPARAAASATAMCRCRPTSRMPTRADDERALPDRVRRDARARWPRRPRRCTSTPRCWRRWRERGVAPRRGDAARRRRHLPAGAHRQPRRAPHAQRVVRGGRGHGRRRSSATRAARRPHRRGRHDHAARAGVGGAARGALQRRRARETDIFITPGFEFRVVDLLLTNFHLPQEHAADAGQRLRRPRARDARCTAHAIDAALPLLQLRRRDAARAR